VISRSLFDINFDFFAGLSSTIPSEIGLLTNLVFVDLDFNELTGILPTELYLLTKLETLDLNDNLLEGNIDSIGVFENMEFLQLQSTSTVLFLALSLLPFRNF